MLFIQQTKLICVSAYKLQFLTENKFLKTEFVTHFQSSPYDQARKTILCVELR